MNEVAPSVTTPAGFRQIDELAAAMLALKESGHLADVSMEPQHFFGEGLYVRALFLPAGSQWVSKLHRERHPYFVLSGHAKVWIENEGWKDIVAPDFGFTEPGTCRVLRIIRDSVWVTVHANPTNTQDLTEIEARVIDARALPAPMTDEQLVALFTPESHDALPATLT